MKPIKTIELKVCGYLSAFNINFIIFSFIFNRFGESLVQTNGRIFTYCLQSVERIIKPSFSADFFVSFTGFVFFIVIIVLFRRGYKTDDLNRQWWTRQLFIKWGSCRTILSARSYTTNCMNIIFNPQYTDLNLKIWFICKRLKD